MIRTYIAAPYDMQYRAIAVASELTIMGFQVNARWLTTPGYPYPGGLSNPDNQQYAREAAYRDIDDIHEADLIILLAPGGLTPTHGRFVELGLAIARAEASNDVSIWYVGPYDNIFCTLPSVHVFPTITAMLEYAAALRGVIHD
jgi:hypothetical protein